MNPAHIPTHATVHPQTSSPVLVQQDTHTYAYAPCTRNKSIIERLTSISMLSTPIDAPLGVMLHATPLLSVYLLPPHTQTALFRTLSSQIRSTKCNANEMQRSARSPPKTNKNENKNQMQNAKCKKMQKRKSMIFQITAYNWTMATVLHSGPQLLQIATHTSVQAPMYKKHRPTIKSQFLLNEFIWRAWKTQRHATLLTHSRERNRSMNPTSH